MKTLALVVIIIAFTTYQIISYATIRTEVLRNDVYRYEMNKIIMDNYTYTKYEYRKVIGVTDNLVTYTSSDDNEYYVDTLQMNLNSFLIGGERQ